MNTTRLRSLVLALATATAISAQDARPDDPVEWVREHGVPFATVDPGSDLDDLAKVAAMVGDARIVGLGEGTHGTREFFQMKHRLTELLVQEKGFSIFAIEASMPEAYRLNDWVLGGDGDPKQLIGGMYFWTWYTEEVLALVKWMRAFNESGEGRVQFTGFDMQTPTVALATVRAWVTEHSPELAAELQPAWDDLERAGQRRWREPGVASASFPIERVAGKKGVFSGAIKTEEASAPAALWWRADAGGKTLAFEQLADGAPTGTTGWARYQIEMAVTYINCR